LSLPWWVPELPVGEKILRALIIYLFLLLVFRFLGRHQVGQMTPFDLVVLLILSNVLQNAMIDPDNSVSGCLIGACTVLAANWIISRWAAASPRFERAVEGVPTMLVHRGQIVEKNLRHECISREELMSNLRSQGVFHVSEIHAAILEVSGRISVLKEEAPHPPDSHS
jgi:uncharacterized membrane protein YcaP (DUF421 family)